MRAVARQLSKRAARRPLQAPLAPVLLLLNETAATRLLSQLNECLCVAVADIIALAGLQGQKGVEQIATIKPQWSAQEEPGAGAGFSHQTNYTPWQSHSALGLQLPCCRMPQ